jgi:hypothetical protein
MKQQRLHSKEDGSHGPRCAVALGLLLAGCYLAV